MKIMVLVKQIPDINAIKFDQKSKRIIRTGVKLLFNSYDKKAVEEAVRLSEKYGCETYAVSMGPSSAAEILNDSMKMGINHAILLNDKNFAGSDTYITSRILSSLIMHINPDMVLSGRSSLDGDTSQVPPETAEMAGYNFVSNVSLIEINGESATVSRDEDNGIRKIKVSLPAFFSVSEKINRARQIDNSAKVEEITVYNSKFTTWKGSDSPTEVIGIIAMESKRDNKFINFEEFINILNEAGKPGQGEEYKILEASNSAENFLGLAVDDPAISLEISSKIAELGNFNITVIGNIAPSLLKGLACHKYIYLENSDNISFSEYAEEFIRKYKVKHVLAPSNLNGRDIASHIAASLGLGLTADCVDIKLNNGKLIQYKPSFGGGIIAVISSKTEPDIATVRKGMFKIKFKSKEYEINNIKLEKSKYFNDLENIPIGNKLHPLDTPVIFGIGTGVNKEDTQLIIEIASKINGSVGATRRVVDMGRMPRQFQIGLTGVSISPELYIAIGLSGSDNHIVGIRYAKNVMAVNSNPEAEIFKHSDFGMVIDSHEFIEKLYKLLIMK
ncbi:FAD-binding protein [Ferroplasma sp.]|uniref:FAD-binding protein n=1 Tax=Ferroplasma sp. TaxID=2591003 RepID=UPI00307F937A